MDKLFTFVPPVLEAGFSVVGSVGVEGVVSIDFWQTTILLLWEHLEFNHLFVPPLMQAGQITAQGESSISLPLGPCLVPKFL